MDQVHIRSTGASGRVLELIRFGGRSDLIGGHSDLISDLLVIFLFLFFKVLKLIRIWVTLTYFWGHSDLIT